MKVLVLFFDMVRVNLTNTYSKTNYRSIFDNTLERIGGTLFTNCYTPGPDTPRSLACMWSSNYPLKNGCNNRLKYPKFYLNKNLKDWASYLKNCGYNMSFFLTPEERQLGELPASVSQYGYHSQGESLNDFLESLQVSDNSLTFIAVDVFHEVISDYYARRKYVHKAFDMVGNALNLIDEKIHIDEFDMTIVFSDHGFKMREQLYRSPLDLMGDDRTQIFMFVHKNGDMGIRYDNKLSSIMDVYPTILNACQIKYDQVIMGKDLFNVEEKYEWLLIEDHLTFNVSLGQTIESWAIRNEKGLACVNSSKRWMANYTLTEKEKNKYEEFLKTESSCYEENTRLREIHESYDAVVNTPFYFDGTPRKVHKPVINIVYDIINDFGNKIIQFLRLINSKL